jgi:hypothetical protein
LATRPHARGATKATVHETNPKAGSSSTRGMGSNTPIAIPTLGTNWSHGHMRSRTRGQGTDIHTLHMRCVRGAVVEAGGGGGGGGGGRRRRRGGGAAVVAVAGGYG